MRTVEQIYFAPSDRLGELHDFLSKFKEIEGLLGSAIRLRIVVDTNIILGDIRWLVKKRKTDGARTSLLEVIDSGTIEAYAPNKVYVEMEKHIQSVCEDEGLDQEKMTQTWMEYQKKLKIIDLDDTQLEWEDNPADPDDVPFVVLERMLEAAGVLSLDPHISQMGGNQLSVDFIMSLRNYSRATAIELNIKVAGISGGIVSLSLLRTVIVSISNQIKAAGTLPNWVKYLILLGALFCAINPKARLKISRFYASTISGIKEVAPKVLDHIGEATLLAGSQKEVAEAHLKHALKELNNNKSN